MKPGRSAKAPRRSKDGKTSREGTASTTSKDGKGPSLMGSAASSTVYDRSFSLATVGSVGIDLPAEPTPSSAKTPHREPRLIPAQYILSVQAEWDRKLSCELAVQGSHLKVAKIREQLKKRMALLEEEQLKALQLRNGNALEKLEEELEDCQTRLSRLRQLEERVVARQPHQFHDHLITMLQHLDESMLADDDILVQCLVNRIESFNLKDVNASVSKTLKLKGRVRCMCKDPEEPYQVYVGFDNGCVQLYDLVMMQEVKTFEMGVYPISCVLVARLNGRKRLLTAGKDKTVRVWDLATDDCTHILTDHGGRVKSMHAFEDTIYTAGFDRRVLFWDLQRGRCGGTLLQADSPIHSALFFRPEGGSALFAAGTRDGMVHLHTCGPTSRSLVPDSHRLLKGHTEAVRCLLYCSAFLFSGSDDKTVIQWDLRDGTRAQEYRRHVDSVMDIKVTGDNLLLSASRDALVILWSINDGSFIRELRHHYHWVCCMELFMMPSSRRSASPKKAELRRFATMDSLSPSSRSRGLRRTASATSSNEQGQRGASPNLVGRSSPSKSRKSGSADRASSSRKSNATPSSGESRDSPFSESSPSSRQRLRSPDVSPTRGRKHGSARQTIGRAATTLLDSSTGSMEDGPPRRSRQTSEGSHRKNSPLKGKRGLGDSASIMLPEVQSCDLQSQIFPLTTDRPKESKPKSPQEVLHLLSGSYDKTLCLLQVYM
eukprot:GGOE01018477.1.p1 GENE.GGOE01018477.1~~GGOE01018477.1.p1  ORF type:complete len:715 (-),score=186.42 GGOE01018477.1:161-2305(-)